MKRVVIFFIFVGLFSLTYQLGSMSEVDEDEAQNFVEEFEALIEDIDSIGIFIHNTSLSLPMFIPGFGVAWGLFSAWSTGYAFASIVSLTPLLVDIPPLALLFLTPFGLMELTAYSIGISRSYILINQILRKSSLRSSMKITAVEIGIVIGLLLAGGFVEFYMIEHIQESELEMPEF